MAFKSQLLLRQLRDIFGNEGEQGARRLLAAATGGSEKTLVDRVDRLLAQVDSSYASYAGLHHWQSLLSGDVYSDWNLKTGNIESGRQWKALLGYEPDELDNVIAQWQRLVHPDDLVILQKKIAAHVQSRERYFESECRLRAKSGQWCWLLLRGAVTARDPSGEASHMLVLHRQINEIKNTEAAMLAAKEAAEAANKSRGAFLANVSHEIRTPMNGIIGMTELALDTKLDAEQRHYLKTVKSSAEALLTIINDILDFSKIEAGKLQFESVPFSLTSLVLEAARVLAVSAHKKGLELLVQVDPDVPSRVIGDPTRLRQVLINLIGNAVKFTAQGEVVLSVGLYRSAGADFLKFSVRDTGIGIPVSKQQAIFEAFSQADASTTRRFGGTGLGLAICVRLVQLMDGLLWLESEEGQGALFCFTARLPTDAEIAVPLPTQRFAGRRALVVEDNAAAGRLLVGLLERLGMQTSLAETGEAAWAAIGQSRAVDFPYDFIFADARMPAPAGFALAETWQKGGGKEKLLMLLSTENQRSDLEHLRQLGIAAYLVKPLGAEELLDALVLVDGGVVSAHESEGFELAPFEALDQSMTTPERVLDILVVEDNPVNQELALRLLQKKNHRVVLANNGVEAIEQFENKRFDLILMDMQMPVMGGIEATEAIRSREMRRSWVVSEFFLPVQIVAMTANVMASDRQRCLDAGMNDFLAKPLRVDDLFSTIARVTGASSGADSDGGADEKPVARLDLRAALKDIGDLDLFISMASMFLAEWQTHVERVRAALQAEVQHDLHLHAHTLKSLLAMFHAETARQFALGLERSTQGGMTDWSDCRCQFEQLLAELGHVKPELERFVNTRVVD